MDANRVCLLIFLILLPSGVRADAIDLDCPTDQRKMTVDVRVRVPLASALPEGKDFLALSPPFLKLHPRDHQRREIASNYDVIGSYLHANFCGVYPELLGEVLVIQLGPTELQIPMTQLTTRRDTSRARPLVHVNGTEALIPNWISLTKVTVDEPKEDNYVYLGMEFLVPSGTQLHIQSLKIQAISSEETLACRGYSFVDDAKRLRLPVHLMAQAGAGTEVQLHQGVFYPGVHCGADAAVVVNFGPLSHKERALRQRVVVRLSRVVLIDPSGLESIQSACSIGDRLTEYHIGEDSPCIFVRKARKHPELSLPSRAFRVEVQESNVYPDSLTVEGVRR